MLTEKKTENIDEIQTKKALTIAHKTVWSVLANKNRVEILFKLCESELSWSDLMFSLKINPRSLSSHLKYLQEYEIVRKNDKNYSLTDIGEKLCELNFINFDDLPDIS